jgi:hypothetical protein
MTEVAFPLFTAVAAEVGGGNVTKGYTMIGKQLYSISGIEGIVETCEAIKACNGNPACIAKNVGMLLVGIAAIAANAIPGVGEAADAAMVAERAAMIAEKAAIAAQDAKKIAKTAEAIKKAENTEKKAKEITDSIKADKAAGRPPQSTKTTREKFQDLNDKLQQIQQQGTSQPPPDYNIPPDAPIRSQVSGTEAAAAAAAAGAAIAGGAYLATRGSGAGGEPPGGEPPGESGGEPPGGSGGGGVNVIGHPININLEMSGHDAMFGTSGYDDRTTFAWFLIFFLIICIIIVE